MGAKVCAIIPALDEEGAIAQVVSKVRRNGADLVIVVDNGSTDRTAHEARQAGACVVSEPKRGYGQACWRGVVTARTAQPSVIVFMDGDGADQGADLHQVVAPILRGEADLVLGARVLGAGPGVLPLQQRAGNWIARVLLRWLYRAHLQDIGSFRAVRAEWLEQLQMQDRAYGWPIEMIVKTLRQRGRIVEVPVSVQQRIGDSKVSGTLRGTIRAGYGTMRYLFLYAREGKREGGV